MKDDQPKPPQKKTLNLENVRLQGANRDGIGLKGEWDVNMKNVSINEVGRDAMSLEDSESQKQASNRTNNNRNAYISKIIIASIGGIISGCVLYLIFG